MGELDNVDRAILNAWSLTWSHPNKRVAMLEEETGLSPTRQAQRLNQLIDTREALEAYPVTVNRLRRHRAGNQRSRRAREANTP